MYGGNEYMAALSLQNVPGMANISPDQIMEIIRGRGRLTRGRIEEILETQPQGYAPGRGVWGVTTPERQAREREDLLLKIGQEFAPFMTSAITRLNELAAEAVGYLKDLAGGPSPTSTAPRSREEPMYAVPPPFWATPTYDTTRTRRNPITGKLEIPLDLSFPPPPPRGTFESPQNIPLPPPAPENWEVEPGEQSSRSNGVIINNYLNMLPDTDVEGFRKTMDLMLDKYV